ncbi:hypothetical protein J3458_020657 [Metarhizium acridum]|uniref:uncharacterized protein n=1 Tax=Metarhizium acridum TaxID=92637 RepID=UPI001C6A9582|nr:hypothetical protein J3458_020657 [Metarhizium acridum]
MFTLEDFIIGRAMTFNDDDVGLETCTSLRISESSDSRIRAEFLCHSGLPYDNASVSIYRKAGFATGLIEDEPGRGWEDDVIVHPSWLDAAIQTGLAAYSFPQDMRLWTLHVPTSVKLLKSTLTSPNWDTARQDSCHIKPALTIHQIAWWPMLTLRLSTARHSCNSTRSASNLLCDSDATIFSQFQYKIAEPNGEHVVSTDCHFPADQEEIVLAAERMGLYYIRRLLKAMTPDEEETILPHYRRLLSWGRYMLDKVTSGKHPTVPPEAVNDTPDVIKALVVKHNSAVDVRLAAAVGENIIRAVRSDGSTLEYMLQNGELDRFYEEAAGLRISNTWIGRMLSQIAHRYPHMHILEVGAGTGGATRSLLPELGTAFCSYTYTDISASFLERAREQFGQYGSRMVYKTFDMDKSPVEQGFKEGFYDIVVASNVLHATGKLHEAMANVRQLLKPGGHLLSLEIQSNELLGIGLIMGCLPGWWAGAESDARRSLGPALPLSRWHSLLAETGFSGVDTATPAMHKLHSYSVFSAQAMLPSDVALFIDFAQTPAGAKTGHLISEHLPQHIPVALHSEFFSTNGTVVPGISAEEIGQVFKGSWQSLLATPDAVGQARTIPLQEVDSHSIIGEPLTVVDWSTESVKVVVQPIDSGQIFRSDGTYFLVGLSGQLGQPLCLWMVKHGARNVVLTSRSPKEDPKYIKSIEKLGANLKIMTM